MQKFCLQTLDLGYIIYQRFWVFVFTNTKKNVFNEQVYISL